MNAEIELKNTSSFTLPEDAIVNYDGKSYVFISKDANNFLLIEAKTGNSENGFIELLNYANFTQNKIVTKGAYTLLMKLKNKSDE